MHIWCVLHIDAYVLQIMCKQELIIHAKNMAKVWNHITLVTEALWRSVSTANMKIQQKYTEKFDPWIIRIQRLIFSHEQWLEPDNQGEVDK